MSNGSGPNIGCWWLPLVMKMSWHWDVSASLALCVGNPPVTGGFPSQRTSDAQYWYFVWRYPEQTVEKTFNLNASELRSHDVHVMWFLIGVMYAKGMYQGHGWVITWKTSLGDNYISAPRYPMFNLNSGVVCQGKVLPQITTCLWHRASQFEFNNDTTVNSLNSGRLEWNLR